ncbi:MAG: hybrid sensor histidine kinase/response regulator [Terriglobia bacterium]|nr:MAG: hybrid sensor histidine kinase/response regulator [Terriglobia bacterium]
MPAKRFLKDKDRKFRLLFEENPQPMWVFDLESQEFLEVNAAAARLYGYTPEEFQRMSLAAVLGPEDTSRLIADLHAPGVPAARLWRHRTNGGRLIDVETAVHEIQYGGRKAGLAVLMDVTNRRQLEEQLRQAQKMEAVGMLAGGVAHDFNNLLTIITGYSQLILNNLGPNDPNRHSADQIMKAGERAAALTRQLLAFSRRQVLQPRILDVNKLVKSSTTMLQRLIGEDIDLKVSLGTDLGRVSADPGQLEQVLMNLVVNARDAMPKGGSLIIETRNAHLDERYAGRHANVKPGPHVMLAVSDTGHGMDQATRDRLFEPFFTTKTPGKGTGLGLSTVFGIIRQSGGTVEVYSEPNRGTSVKVYLPRIDQPASVEAEDTRKKAARGTETLLVVEDDEMVRSLVRETLEREGYKLIDAADPIEARRLAENYKGPIQLLITDVVMPKINGRELAEQILSRRPAMRVLYMSGYTDNAIVNNGLLEKEVAFLHKPFTPAALAHKVREVLESDDKMLQAGE